MTTPATHPLIARLKAERTRRGITIPTLAHAAGVGTTTIGEAERGGRSPSIDVLTAWAGALGFELALRPIGKGPQLIDAHTGEALGHLSMSQSGSFLVAVRESGSEEQCGGPWGHPGRVVRVVRGEAGR